MHGIASWQAVSIDFMQVVSGCKWENCMLQSCSPPEECKWDTFGCFNLLCYLMKQREPSSSLSHILSIAVYVKTRHKAGRMKKPHVVPSFGTGLFGLSVFVTQPTRHRQNHEGVPQFLHWSHICLQHDLLCFALPRSAFRFASYPWKLCKRML